MVYKYKRKSNRGEGWTENDMKVALTSIDKDELKIREAARRFGIPYATLRKHHAKKTDNTLGRFRPVFAKEEEELLVGYIRDVDDVFYGLDREDLSCLAFEFSRENNIKHPFQGEREQVNNGYKLLW